MSTDKFLDKWDNTTRAAERADEDYGKGLSLAQSWEGHVGLHVALATDPAARREFFRRVLHIAARTCSAEELTALRDAFAGQAASKAAGLGAAGQKPVDQSFEEAAEQAVKVVSGEFERPKPSEPKPSDSKRGRPERTSLKAVKEKVK